MEDPKVMIMPHPDASESEPPPLARQNAEVRECPMEPLIDPLREMTIAMGAAFLVGGLTGVVLMWAFSKKHTE